MQGGHGIERDVREALDEAVFMSDLAALVLGVLLGAIGLASVGLSNDRGDGAHVRLDLLGGRVVLARDLWASRQQCSAGQGIYRGVLLTM